MNKVVELIKTAILLAAAGACVMGGMGIVDRLMPDKSVYYYVCIQDSEGKNDCEPLNQPNRR